MDTNKLDTNKLEKQILFLQLKIGKLNNEIKTIEQEDKKKKKLFNTLMGGRKYHFNSSQIQLGMKMINGNNPNKIKNNKKLIEMYAKSLEKKLNQRKTSQT